MQHNKLVEHYLYNCDLPRQGLKLYLFLTELFQTLFGDIDVIKFDTMNK